MTEANAGRDQSSDGKSWGTITTVLSVVANDSIIRLAQKIQDTPTIGGVNRAVCELISSVPLFWRINFLRPLIRATLARAQTTRKSVLAELRQLAAVIEPQPLPAPVCRDPDDDHVIACAIAARADAIISGDRDLLELRKFRSIPILRVRDALEVFASQ